MVIHYAELSHKLWKKILYGERLTPREQKKFDGLEKWISKGFDENRYDEVAITINNKGDR